ncbi:hypothetical protein CPB84DRAFT_1795526 [Gymnopilus junonius]|uniref:Transmembrane protein n=1 Tax=Gymnopilus junonius TaxID=109634 RepID=A0A9P5NAE1_GYMJU|nr:hypothetical protein CPB84DRAFT_1795526 [Gymnopilus junonius]
MLRILKHNKASSVSKESVAPVEERCKSHPFAAFLPQYTISSQPPLYPVPPYSAVDPAYQHLPVIPAPLPAHYYDQYAREYEEFIRTRMNGSQEPKRKKKKSVWKMIFVVIGTWYVYCYGLIQQPSL